MIAYSKERLLVLDDSIVTLWNEDKGIYYYVDVDTFSSACVLHSKFEESLDALVDAIGGTPDYECIKVAIEELPKPLNIYGYFLALVSSNLTTFDDIVGGLMLITDIIDFNTFLAIDPAIRKKPRLASKLQDRYVPIWKKFFASAMNYDEAIDKLTAMQAPVYAPSPTEYQPAPVTSSSSDSWSDLLSDLDSSFDNIDSKHKTVKIEEDKEYTGGLSLLEEAKAQEEKKARAFI
jgi:hypothetical protein